MKSQTLCPQFAHVGDVQGHRQISEIAEEPSLFSCSLEHAQIRGGEITREVLTQVLAVCKPAMVAAYEAGLHEVIDVRVQRLMVGMYPSIPGWHCDAVPRADYFSQPDFSRVPPQGFHVTCLVDTDTHGQGISNTAFLGERLDFTYDDTQPVWRQLHQQIEAAPRRVSYVKPGRLMCFDSFTPHKTSPTRKRGWRYFFRLSMYHNPPVANGVPAQSQVYLLSEENGW